MWTAALLLPAEQDVVVLMSDDLSCTQSYRAFIARRQAVFPQLHSVVVAVTVGWQTTLCSLEGLDSGTDFSACVKLIKMMVDLKCLVVLSE